MTTITLLDDRTRPLAPKFEGLTPFQQLHGKTLQRIHAMYLEELTEVSRIMRLVEAGEKALPDLQLAIDNLPMVQAYRTFGTLCGRECKLLQFHHDAEENGIFPALRGHADEELLAVLDRLAEEHRVIHAHIEVLSERAHAVSTAPNPTRFAAARDALIALDQLVRSHFRYEEGELADPIGHYNVPI